MVPALLYEAILPQLCETGRFGWVRDSNADPADAVDLAWEGGNVASIIEDHRGIIWFGSWDGWLGSYDRTSDQFLRFDLGYPIMGIYEDRAGELWIATDGGAGLSHRLVRVR